MAALLSTSLATGVAGVAVTAGEDVFAILRAFIMAASFKNRLSPTATDSLFKMCVAGCEKGCESRDVMRNRRSLRFLQQRAAVLGPSTSDRARRRLREGRGGHAGGGVGDGEVSGRLLGNVICNGVSCGRAIGPGVRGMRSSSADAGGCGCDCDCVETVGGTSSATVSGVSTSESACAGRDADIRCVFTVG